MQDAIGFIKKATEKRLRKLQIWRKACLAIAKEYRSDEPDAGVLRTNLDRLEGWSEAFPNDKETYRELEADVRQRYQRYIRRFEGRLRKACERNGFGIAGRLPRLIVDGLIEVQVYPDKNAARINRKRANDLSLPTVIGKITEEHKRLWGRRFYPKAFMKRLYEAYEKVQKPAAASEGQQVPVKQVYDQLSDGDENYKFDMFAADLSRLLESGELMTAKKKQLELGPVRDNRQAVYVFDRRSGKGRYLGLVRFK